MLILLYIHIFYTVTMSNDITKNHAEAQGWLPILEGTFTCSECENEVRPLISTASGMQEADVTEVMNQLTQFPNKVIFAVCPVCGMEYVFKKVEGELWLEPSDEEK